MGYKPTAKHRNEKTPVDAASGEGDPCAWQLVQDETLLVPPSQ
jgi:hypothetical protein